MTTGCMNSQQTDSIASSCSRYLTSQTKNNIYSNVRTNKPAFCKASKDGAVKL